MRRTSPSFTLVELLIVIGILAVLATVTVLVINPAELFKQGRDSTRAADLRTLSVALSLADLESLSPGSANTVYVSIPDSDSACANLGLPSLPAGYAYACATSANYRKVDGTGWIPVAFTSIIQGSPLSQLLIDPVNTTSSGSYYTYVTGGSWELNAQLESSRYAEIAAKDGGGDPVILEAGNDLDLVNFGRNLIAYWKLDESSGNLVDSTLNDWTGTPSGSPSYGTTGHSGTALTFDGTDDYVDVGDPFLWTSPFAVSFWVRSSAAERKGVVGVGSSFGSRSWDVFNEWNGSSFYDFRVRVNATDSIINTSSQDGNWHFVALVYDGSNARFTVDRTTNTFSVSAVDGGGNFYIGGNMYTPVGAPEWQNGEIDDVRIYNRALSAAEIEAMYNGMP